MAINFTTSKLQIMKEYKDKILLKMFLILLIIIPIIVSIEAKNPTVYKKECLTFKVYYPDRSIEYIRYEGNIYKTNHEYKRINHEIPSGFFTRHRHLKIGEVGPSIRTAYGLSYYEIVKKDIIYYTKEEYDKMNHFQKQNRLIRNYKQQIKAWKK